MFQSGAQSTADKLREIRAVEKYRARTRKRLIASAPQCESEHDAIMWIADAVSVGLIETDQYSIAARSAMYGFIESLGDLGIDKTAFDNALLQFNKVGEAHRAEFIKLGLRHG